MGNLNLRELRDPRSRGHSRHDARIETAYRAGGQPELHVHPQHETEWTSEAAQRCSGRELSEDQSLRIMQAHINGIDAPLRQARGHAWRHLCTVGIEHDELTTRFVTYRLDAIHEQ